MAERIIPQEVQTVDGQYRWGRKEGELLKLTMLHQGNSCVELNQTETQIICFAYLTEDERYEGDKNKWTYRRITAELVEDILVDDSQPEDKRETVIATQPNQLPVVPFYDNKKPARGVWLSIPEDLLSFQEMLNLVLTDIENAMRWQMIKQLFINADIKHQAQSLIPYAPFGHTPAGEYTRTLT
jgi:hypothetical protein